MAFTKRDPTLFISYRRDDASANAGRLYDWLERQFGRRNVFLDTQEIAPGDDFVQVLETRLAEADVLLAVVGPEWLESRNDAGRRLDQADDFVRLEILTALNRGVRVIPVLVGDASMPPPAALPEALAAFSHCNAFSLRDDSFERDFNALVDIILERPRGHLRREADRFRRLVRALKLTSLLVPALALAVVFGVWVSLLAPLNLETLSQNALLWVADEFDPLPDDPGVVLVAIDDESERVLGPPAFGPSAHWRALLARLIERAHAAGARAVAFDIAFTATTDADTALATAATRAMAAEPPTRVVLGGHRLDAGQPRLAPALAGQPWGSTCLRRRGHAYAAPLAVLDAQDRGGALVPAHLPAFALRAAVPGQVEEIDLDRRTVRSEGGVGSLPRYSTIERIKTTLCDTLRSGDDAAMLLIRPSRPEYWQRPPRRIGLAESLDATLTPDSRLAGRILLVGDTRSGSPDRHALRRGASSRSVPGVELHAEAIATLLNHRETVLPTADRSAFALAVMALAGAGTGFFAAPLPRWRRHLVTLAVPLVYLAIALALATRGVLLNLPYDLMAFGLAWLVLHRLQRPDRIEADSP